MTDPPGGRRAELDATFGLLRATIESVVQYPPHRCLLNEAVDSLVRTIASEGSHRLAATDLALIITSGLDAAEHGVGLAAATTASYIGIDVIDDLLDGDAPLYWEDANPSEVALGGALAYCTLAQSLILQLSVSAECRVALLQDLTETLVTLAAAEDRDVASFGSPLAPGETQQIVAGKSGAMLACFARMAALVSGVVPGPRLDRFGEFGRRLAIARQLASDIVELAPATESSDHRNQAATLPIALAAAELGTDEVHDLQAKASRSAEGRRELWDKLVSSGAITRAVLQTEVAAAQAEIQANSLGLDPTALAALRGLCRRASLIELTTHTTVSDDTV